MASEVRGIITAAQATARSLAVEAGQYVNDAIRAFDTRYEVIPGDIAVSFPDVDFEVGQVPQYSGAHFEAPAEPGAAPEMREVPSLDMGAAPALTADKPAFELPSTPAELAEFQTVAPTLGDIVVPPAPGALDHLDITPPVLSTIVVPAAPQVALPEFFAQSPDTDLPDPGDLAAQYRADFAEQGPRLSSALLGQVDAYMDKVNPRFKEQMARLEDRLAKYLEGGTALKAEVEDAIYARAMDRTNAEYLRVRDTAYEDAARRGFTLPTGALNSAVFQARQAAADNNARAAMEIAIKQAELEQQNLQFAVSQSLALRQMVLGITQNWAGTLVQLNSQALQFAQGVLQATVDLYSVKVQVVQAKVAVYQAEAQVYEYRLKATLAVYDVYQAQIKGLEAQVNVDTAKVQAFVAQANSYGALANAYKAVVDGIATKAQIEKLKVEAFGAEVQAYSARVSAKTAEWQGFRAQVEGQVSRVDAYKAEVQAFSGEVDAYKATIQAKATQIQAVTATNESAARTYAAAVGAYTALVQGRSAAVSAEINSFESTLKGYTAGVNAQEARARVVATNAAMTGQTAIAAYRAQVETMISNASMNYQRMTGTAKVATMGADSYARMAASALSGMNSFASQNENYSL